MTTTAKPLTRAQALAEPSAEVLLNGRCVGRLEYDPKVGTCLVMTWHADDCEHLAALTLAARRWLFDNGHAVPRSFALVRSYVDENYDGGWAGFAEAQS